MFSFYFLWENDTFLNKIIFFREKLIFNFWEKFNFQTNLFFSEKKKKPFLFRKSFLPEIIKCFPKIIFLRKIKDFWENVHFLPTTFQPLILKSRVRTHLHLEPGVLRTQADITGCDQINTCDTEQHPQWTTMTLSRVHTSTITPSSPRFTWFLSSLLPEKKCR